MLYRSQCIAQAFFYFELKFNYGKYSLCPITIFCIVGIFAISKLYISATLSVKPTPLCELVQYTGSNYADFFLASGITEPTS